MPNININSLSDSRWAKVCNNFMHYRKHKQRTCWVWLPSRTLLSGGASCAAKQDNTEGYPYKLKVNVNGAQTTANRGQRRQNIVGSPDKIGTPTPFVCWGFVGGFGKSMTQRRICPFRWWIMREGRILSGCNTGKKCKRRS